MALTQVKY